MTTRDLDFAYIEYKQVYELDPNLTIVRDDLLRLSKRLGYDDDFQDWKKKFGKGYGDDTKNGELVTIFQSGRGPIKISRGNLLKDSDMGPAIRIAVSTGNLGAGVTVAAIYATLRNAENPIPRFQKRTNKVDKVKVEAGGKTLNTTLLENVEDTAVRNLEDDYGYLHKRVAAAIVTKVAASIAAGIVAKKVAEQFKKTRGAAGLIGTLAGAGTGAALFSQMKPDLRCWHTLPAGFQLGRMKMKPGPYKLKFMMMSGGGIVESVEKEVEIKKGEKTLVNLRTLY